MSNIVKLWAVLGITEDNGQKACRGDGKEVTCFGVYTSPEKAALNCHEQCNIMLFELDKPWPEKNIEADECYFPHLETREEGKLRLQELKDNNVR